MSIDQLKEILDMIHPYTRWVTVLLYAACFLWINRIFVKDPALRKWIMSSFEEVTGKSSSKSLTAFIFVQLVAFATVSAIVYAPNHLLPEYFLYALLAFVASLYGIKLASRSKMFSGDTDNTSQSQTTTTTTTDTTTKDVKTTNKPDKPEEPEKQGTGDKE